MLLPFRKINASDMGGGGKLNSNHSNKAFNGETTQKTCQRLYIIVLRDMNMQKGICLDVINNVCVP